MKKKNILFWIFIVIASICIFSSIYYLFDSDMWVLRKIFSDYKENFYFEFYIRFIRAVHFLITLIFIGVLIIYEEKKEKFYEIKESKFVKILSKIMVVIVFLVPFSICVYNLSNYIKDFLNIKNNNYKIAEWNHSDNIRANEGGSHEGGPSYYIILDSGEELNITREQYEEVEEMNRGYKPKKEKPKGNVYYMEYTKIVLKLERK